MAPRSHPLVHVSLGACRRHGGLGKHTDAGPFLRRGASITYRLALQGHCSLVHVPADCGPVPKTHSPGTPTLIFAPRFRTPRPPAADNPCLKLWLFCSRFFFDCALQTRTPARIFAVKALHCQLSQCSLHRTSRTFIRRHHVGLRRRRRLW